MHPSPATIAEFYRLALRLDSEAAANDARAWAYRTIEREAEPLPEIIDVAWSKTVNELEESLKSVPGERDPGLAGKWVLRELRDRYLMEGQDVQWCAQRAMQIVEAASLGESLYYHFDEVDEDAFLEATTPGSVAGVSQRRLSEILEQFPPLPSSEA